MSGLIAGRRGIGQVKQAARGDLVPVPDRVRIVMRMLTDAADKGDVCPNNNLITAAIGACSASAGAGVVALLEAMNLIRVERNRKFRVVTILATGKRTAGSVKNPVTFQRSGGDGAVTTYWRPTRDAALMQRIADGADFEQAGLVCGCTGDQAAARFDELRLAMGPQAV